jgi:hypothetical protein
VREILDFGFWILDWGGVAPTEARQSWSIEMSFSGISRVGSIENPKSKIQNC